MVKTTLLLIRHGESEANREKVFGGQYDAPLAESGMHQARITGQFIKENYKVHAIYTSDLERAHSTANCIAEAVGIEVIPTVGLREIHGGEWEGKKYELIQSVYKEAFSVWKNDTGKARCTGGESVRELGKRIMDTLENIANENLGKTVVISTHATPVRVIQCLVQTGGLEEMVNTPWVSNASVTELVYKKGKWALGKIGMDAHLSKYRITLPKTV